MELGGSYLLPCLVCSVVYILRRASLSFSFYSFFFFWIDCWGGMRYLSYLKLTFWVLGSLGGGFGG